MPILAWITRREVQYLGQQDKKSTYSETADSHTKPRKKIKTNHDRKTAHGTTAGFFSPVENPSFVHLFFTTQFFKNYCIIRVARTKSPHGARTRAGHVLRRLPLLLYGSPPRRGESEPSPEGRLPTLRFSSCGQEHSFHYHQIHVTNNININK